MSEVPGGGTAIGWSTHMLGRIGYAFWQFMCQKGYGFQICVPERVGFEVPNVCQKGEGFSKFALNWHFMINFPALRAKFRAYTQFLSYNYSGISIYF